MQYNKELNDLVIRLIELHKAFNEVSENNVPLNSKKHVLSSITNESAEIVVRIEAIAKGETNETLVPGGPRSHNPYSDLR